MSMQPAPLLNRPKTGRQPGPLRRAGFAALTLFLFGATAVPAHGQDLELFLEDFSAVLSEVLTVRTVHAICAEREPDRAEERAAGLATWEQLNGVRVFDSLRAGLAYESDEVARQLAAADIDARVQIEPQLDASNQGCSELDGEETEAGALGDAILDLALLGHQIELRPRPAAIPNTVSISPMTEMTLRAFEIMDLVTPDNAGGEDLVEAREAFLEYYLDAWGYVAGYGRIGEDGEVREWRGDYQSLLALECASFADDAQEAAFEAGRGQDMIIIGEPRFAYIRSEQGRIRLNDCWIFEFEGETETAQADDDTEGLMLRPLDMADAYGGPMAGPALADIDRVLYDASFQNRLDGFGNGYVDRREAIYVLLRDGRAFLHDWSFPVTDIDLDALARREPDHLFSWHDDWGTVVLQASDGEEVRLEGARELRPAGDGRTLDQEYYYLQVGMGGHRRDRAYNFDAGGQLVYTRSGFLAGNFGTSYIIAAGGDETESKGRYHIEGYALVIETPEGEERQFFAVGEDDDPNAPGEVIIGGAVYWLRD